MARLLRVLAASIFARGIPPISRLARIAAIVSIVALAGCHARVGGLVRSPVAPVEGGPTDDPDGMWAYTTPGELPWIEVVGEASTLPLEHTHVAASARAQLPVGAHHQPRVGHPNVPAARGHHRQERHRPHPRRCR